MTVAISKAAEDGAKVVVCASTGNTSASAAAYAARAGMIAAVVYAFDSYPITDIVPAVLWLMLLALLSFLMISTWRYWSFKDLNLLRPRTPLILVVMGGVIYGIVYWSQPVLVILASIYVGSGIAIRVGGTLRRHLRHTPKVNPETQVG